MISRVCQREGCDRQLFAQNKSGWCYKHYDHRPARLKRKSRYWTERYRTDKAFRDRVKLMRYHRYWTDHDFRNACRRRGREYKYLKGELARRRASVPCEFCGEFVLEDDAQMVEVNGVPVRDPNHAWCLIGEFEESSLDV